MPEIAVELDSSFKEIEEGSHTVARLISEITSATSEQAQGVDQVNTAVAQMDKVTQSNAATSEEAASAAEELSAQAGSLNGLVEDLVQLVEGSGGDGAAPRTGGGLGHGNGGRAPHRRIATPPPSPRKVMKVRKFDGETSGRDGNVRMLSSSEVIPLDDGDDF